MDLRHFVEVGAQLVTGNRLAEIPSSGVPDSLVERVGTHQHVGLHRTKGKEEKAKAKAKASTDYKHVMA